MDPYLFKFLHAFSAVLLIAVTFYIAANPQKHKKAKLAAISGILSVLVLVFGIGVMHILYKDKWMSYFAETWLIIKLVCWLAISAMGGMAYKKSKSLVLGVTIVAAGAAMYIAIAHIKG